MSTKKVHISESRMEFLQQSGAKPSERLAPLGIEGDPITRPPQTPRYNAAVMFEGFQGRESLLGLS